MPQNARIEAVKPLVVTRGDGIARGANVGVVHEQVLRRRIDVRY